MESEEDDTPEEHPERDETESDELVFPAEVSIQIAGCG
jgi:hypothetical protein